MIHPDNSNWGKKINTPSHQRLDRLGTTGLNHRIFQFRLHFKNLSANILKWIPLSFFLFFFLNNDPERSTKRTRSRSRIRNNEASSWISEATTVVHPRFHAYARSRATNLFPLRLLTEYSNRLGIRIESLREQLLRFLWSHVPIIIFKFDQLQNFSYLKFLLIFFLLRVPA